MQLSTHLAVLGVVALNPCSAVDLQVPPSKPDGSFTVPQDFVGFGIESAFFNNYANQFSENLVSSLASRMSNTPILRIGGTSGDYFTFDPDQAEDKKCVSDEGCGGHKGHYSLGPSYFDGYLSFTNAKMIIQAPLPKPLNMQSTLDYVWQAWNNLGEGDRVAAIALGNEPEFIYDTNVDDYVQAALEIQDGIMRNLSLFGDVARLFEAGNTASATAASDDGAANVYNVEEILGTRINDNGKIAAAAEHYYQMDTDNQWTEEEMQNQMLNHKAISDRLDLYVPSIEASRQRGIAYAITEDAAVLGGAPTEFSGGFGYALWAVDFNLAAMTRGVARVSNLAGRPSAKRVFWVPDSSGQPNNDKPEVRAPFASAMFLADFINNESGTAVQEIGTDTEVTSAYAMYDNESNRVRRVALLNMNFYNGTSGNEDRGSQTFRVPVPADVERVTVRRLHAARGVGGMGFDYGGPESNVTWAGEQWTHGVDLGNGHFPSGNTEEETVEVQDSVAAVEVQDSEAVIIFIPAAD